MTKQEILNLLDAAKIDELVMIPKNLSNLLTVNSLRVTWHRKRKTDTAIPALKYVSASKYIILYKEK